jgi:hypothetical protein
VMAIDTCSVTWRKSVATPRGRTATINPNDHPRHRIECRRSRNRRAGRPPAPPVHNTPSSRSEAKADSSLDVRARTYASSAGRALVAPTCLCRPRRSHSSAEPEHGCSDHDGEALPHSRLVPHRPILFLARILLGEPGAAPQCLEELRRACLERRGRSGCSGRPLRASTAFAA